MLGPKSTTEQDDDVRNFQRDYDLFLPKCVKLMLSFPSKSLELWKWQQHASGSLEYEGRLESKERLPLKNIYW